MTSAVIYAPSQGVSDVAVTAVQATTSSRQGLWQAPPLSVPVGADLTIRAQAVSSFQGSRRIQLEYYINTPDDRWLYFLTDEQVLEPDDPRWFEPMSIQLRQAGSCWMSVFALGTGYQPRLWEGNVATAVVGDGGGGGGSSSANPLGQALQAMVPLLLLGMVMDLMRGLPGITRRKR